MVLKYEVAPLRLENDIWGFSGLLMMNLTPNIGYYIRLERDLGPFIKFTSSTPPDYSL